MITCIDITNNYIASCTLDRDLRVWELETGTFIKKFDLCTFTDEAVSVIKFTSETTLYLGSKDSRIYAIDVNKGKLITVYEGHWSRITSLYTTGKDTLVSVSDHNIKVWDLEFNECIKNMNEHTGNVVYCRVMGD